jgi:hypothetical protein
MGDLAALLARPGQEIHVLDLITADSGGVLEQRAADETIDAQARNAYRSSLNDIEAELDEAHLAADAGRAERLQLERDALIAELAAAYGIAGRVRRGGGDSAERARSTVTKRLREALRRIQTQHPRLGRHLTASLHTGIFCSYDPEAPVTWNLKRS